MDNQKDIEGMAQILYSCSNTTCECCNVHCVDYLRGQVLANAGYGNVKQAVREFAELLEIELIFKGLLEASNIVKSFIEEFFNENITTTNRDWLYTLGDFELVAEISSRVAKAEEEYLSFSSDIAVLDILDKARLKVANWLADEYKNDGGAK